MTRPPPAVLLMQLPLVAGAKPLCSRPSPLANASSLVPAVAAKPRGAGAAAAVNASLTCCKADGGAGPGARLLPATMVGAERLDAAAAAVPLRLLSVWLTDGADAAGIRARGSTRLLAGGAGCGWRARCSNRGAGNAGGSSQQSQRSGRCARAAAATHRRVGCYSIGSTAGPASRAKHRCWRSRARPGKEVVRPRAQPTPIHRSGTVECTRFVRGGSSLCHTIGVHVSLPQQ